MNKTVYLFIFWAYGVISLISCQNSDSLNVGIPVEEVYSAIQEFDRQAVYNPEWKLESDDHKLTVYTTVDSIEGYPSLCAVLYHDGNQTKVVSESLWRKKYNLKSDDYCPLFSSYHSKLYTIQNKIKPEDPIYVLVTEELLENCYGKNNGMCIYAHAYRIKDGQLQPENAFSNEDKFDYMTRPDTMEWVEWVHDIESIWPSTYDKKTRTLSLASLVNKNWEGYSSLLSEQWAYDDKIGFKNDDATYEGGDNDDYEIVAMSEKFPKHKIKITLDNETDGFQYLSWPSKSKWDSKPSVVVGNGKNNIIDGTYRFKSKDNYEYVVFENPSPEGPGPSIVAVEVRKDGRILYREEIDY